MTDFPCTASEAVARGRALLEAKTGQYVLGTGDYKPLGPDDPWTENAGMIGSDCAGFAISYCWKLVRHRPGFNVGAWATIADDINNNSALEDGQHRQELFTTLADGCTPQPGDLIVWPTIYLTIDGQRREFIGHVGLVEEVPETWLPRVFDAELKLIAGSGWHELTILQCHGPNGFKPGVVRTDGSMWDWHDHQWPKNEHRTHIVRPHERR